MTLHKLCSYGLTMTAQPKVIKIDATRDIGGFFYAGSDWRTKHRRLCDALEQQFGTTFRDNGNSFDTCFQFVGAHPVDFLPMRVKIYNKTLE